MDLQSLFDELKQEPPATATKPTPSPVRVEAPIQTPPVRAEANAPHSLDSAMALDAILDRGITEPAGQTVTQSEALVASTTVMPAEPPPASTLRPAPAAIPAAQPAPLNPQDARDLASLGGALATDRPGAATTAPKAPALRVGTVALCQRVEGFGRFTSLPTNKFIAGRPALMILYTELAEFSQREELVSETGVETHHVVEVTQQVDLLFDADGSRQFGSPEQLVRDVSRSARRDFFIVQRLELPRNLSVGNYNLKMIVRDKLSGAEAEKIVPIVIVADPVLARTPADSGVITPESLKREAALPAPARPKPKAR